MIDNAYRGVTVMALLVMGGCAGQGTTLGTEQSSGEMPETYEEEAVLSAAESFFGEGARGLADILNKVFTDQGQPNGYIEGEEGGGAFGVGVRYGRGVLRMKDGSTRDVYWRGPSIGFDVGGNAAKTFMLIYDLPDIDSVFQRYPGVEGSLYYVGGVGVNYNRSGGIVLAPIRFGVGWRQGVNVGYVHLSDEASWIPF